MGVKNGDCADVGISQNATFEFTVTADQCFTEEKEVVRSLPLFLSVFLFRALRKDFIAGQP